MSHPTAFLKDFKEPIKFCHINFNHDYYSVKDTIDQVKPLMVDGGIICGDNFTSANAGRTDLHGGVERAVRETMPGFVFSNYIWSWVKKPIEFEPRLHFYDRIEGWFDFQDIYSEAVRNAPDAAHFVEVGCWFGRSTAYMAVEIANSNKTIWFDAVDTWEGSADEEYHLKVVKEHGGNIYKKFITTMKEGNVLEYIKPIRMTSAKASKLYLYNFLDFIFIDAQHTYDAVTEDLNSWYPKLKPGRRLPVTTGIRHLMECKEQSGISLRIIF